MEFEDTQKSRTKRAQPQKETNIILKGHPNRNYDPENTGTNG